MTAEDEALAEIKDWLRRTSRATALSGSGFIPLAVAADWIGVSGATLRRWHDEGTEAPLEFRLVGTRRGLWQIRLTSLAAYEARIGLLPGNTRAIGVIGATGVGPANATTAPCLHGTTRRKEQTR